MNASEKQVKRFLEHHGYVDVVYEPDGNVPPDFSVNGTTAVEVRKLNQHDESALKPRGLAETAIPFESTLRQVLRSLGPPRFGVSWFVSYAFSRPIPDRRIVEKDLRTMLEDFAQTPNSSKASFRLGPINVRLFQASQIHESMFLVGSSMDHNAGGFVVADLIRNVGICVADKTAKVAKFREKYPIWWLALVDEITYGSLDASDIEELRAAVCRPAQWDRIVLVSPVDWSRAFEI